jgi:hypothetical protein
MVFFGAALCTDAQGLGLQAASAVIISRLHGLIERHNQVRKEKPGLGDWEGRNWRNLPRLALSR